MTSNPAVESDANVPALRASARAPFNATVESVGKALC